ncbi:hypothetical protein MMC17_003458 [Xylographa soralifera]|nr:hypothetical protein [Xylographa soralifera]
MPVLEIQRWLRSCGRPARRRAAVYAELITQLAGRLVRSISSSTHYERELQSRALLAALALLDAQGVRALEADFHVSLRAQLNDRFRDLWSVPAGRHSGSFSVESFRRVQCSYCLCLAAEYAKRFVLARPFSISLLSSAASFVVFGVTVASAALGNPSGGLPSAVSSFRNGLRSLEEALRPLWTSQNDLLQALCSLQELTRVAAALTFYDKVSDERNSLNSSHELAIRILRNIQWICDQNAEWD